MVKIITISGIPVFPDNTNAPDLYSIGYGLARTSRFAGQTKIWYPVLAHVHSVASIVSVPNKIHALLHDAAESIVGDQVSTWKNPFTKEDEQRLLQYIYRDQKEALGVDFPLNESDSNRPYAMPEEVAQADAACLAAEAFLLGHSEPDHPHFEQIRLDYPFLYARALDVTEFNIGKFTPEYCLLQTGEAARNYQEYAYELCHGVKT